VREKRGTLGRTVGAVGSIVSAARGRQEKGAIRVVIYDAAGHGRRLKPETDDHERLVEVAEDFVAAVREGPETASESDSEAP
jgi:hypothetical protein